MLVIVLVINIIIKIKSSQQFAIYCESLEIKSTVNEWYS